VPERIRGDVLRLRQVLVNLLGNAVKFTERGEISVHIFCETGRDGRSILRFRVSDTGIGMSEEAMQHLFESFAQADRSTTRKYGGTGLGLAICKRLVNLMGGEISVSSKLGAGTAFEFTIQCVAEEAAQPNEDRALQDMRVLVVDDSDVVCSFIEQNLTRVGMRCRSVQEGADAMQEIQHARQENHPYQIVIMDIGATDADGADLARAIRLDGAPQPRLLLLDRYGSSEDSAAASHHYLGKPLRLDRLLEAIRKLMTGEEAAVDEVPLIQATPNVRPEEREYRVLVAEDNRTNQMVAAGMLSMNGCQCEFASNGREAMEAARSKRFDLILMDCSMPEMDGYEATAQIRSFEQPQGLHTPIVAMTANTQTGDAEKCLAAGMDDYLAKPITLVELRRKLELWLGRVSATSEPSGISRQADVLDEASPGPLDRVVFDKLREILGPALQQAVAPFLEDTPAYLEQLEESTVENDAEKARAAAHAIKGSSGNLGAPDVAQLAKEAEEFALAGRVPEIRPLLPRLRDAFDAVAALLADEVYADSGLNSQQEEKSAEVLIVDDDRSTRRMLRYTLQRDGFRVEEAADGEQALEMLSTLQPDVILMDAVMPVMDGFTACAKVQELPFGRTIPVLMITALEDNESVERAFAAGASDFIPKPIHFAVLSQRVRRIIEANRAEKRIRHMAYNDLLTGLPNRALFIDQLGRRIEQTRQGSGQLAVLFLDLDRFKNVNDTLGHEVGDRLLVEVGQRIRRSVRNADCVARLGGDEFTVVLSDLIGPNAAAAAAQNICRVLSTPFHLDGNDIFVSTSVGISLYPNDGTDVGTLLKHADTAMYRAKRTNSGFQFFEAAMEHSISEQLRLESDLRRALERNELEAYYQPQVDLETGEIIGAEALARWHHPVRGFVPPIEFIPMAEETGLIIQVGEWMLRNACKQLRGWHEAGWTDLRMAVNVSVKQLLQKNFADTVESALSESGIPASSLELEITENTLMEHAEDTLQALARLRNLGVRLSIDDFGTGYSSLAYLKRFSVDALKIDRSFVRDVPSDADDAAIVKGIIALAHSLRLEVVAEGVENVPQLEFLREHHCNSYQGFYMSKPVPHAEFLACLENNAKSRAPQVPRLSNQYAG
jgi:diguanylate cyclase (GGDEF)-like protein